MLHQHFVCVGFTFLVAADVVSRCDGRLSVWCRRPWPQRSPPSRTPAIRGCPKPHTWMAPYPRWRVETASRLKTFSVRYMKGYSVPLPYFCSRSCNFQQSKDKTVKQWDLFTYFFFIYLFIFLFIYLFFWIQAFRVRHSWSRPQLKIFSYAVSATLP